MHMQRDVRVHSTRREALPETYYQKLLYVFRLETCRISAKISQRSAKVVNSLVQRPDPSPFES
jgi:hypothetical protein